MGCSQRVDILFGKMDMNKWDKNYKRKSEEMLYGFMNKEPDLGESLRGMWDQEA